MRRVFIPKPDGTQRPLGIPTVLDRVIQQAVAQVLSPLFEVDFSESSYGLPALNNRAKLAWTDKAQHRFKERVREITSRNRGHKVQAVIGELDQYIRGWLNYYKLSSTYKEVLALSVWVRRRVRLYYWKQWNAARRASRNGPEGARNMADGGNQPRTRRRNLLSLGADPAPVHMATRSRKGYWRMSQNEIVRYVCDDNYNAALTTIKTTH